MFVLLGGGFTGIVQIFGIFIRRGFMKVFISCDIEGIGCVTRPEHSSIEGRDYIQARRLMTGEVNAAVIAAFDSGAERVLVADSHNVGLNLLPEELDRRVELVMGSPRPLSMMEGVQHGFEAVFFVGYHARPGTADGVIAHNFHSRLMETRLHGRVMGEMGFNAALAGFYNAPVALVTGDAATAAEAGDFLPWAETVTVKEGIGAYAARCYSPELCRERIYEGAQKALAGLSSKRLFKIEEPVTLELKVTTASGADRLERVPLLNRIAPTRLKSDPVSLRTALDIFLVSADLVNLCAFI